MPGEVRLIGEADWHGHRCGRDAVIEQQPGLADPKLVEVGVRRQAGRRTERPQQRELTEPGHRRELGQRGRLDEPVVQQVPDGPDGGRCPARRTGVGGRTPGRMRPQQAAECRSQQRRGGELVAVLGRLVRTAQERRRGRVVHHRLREPWRPSREAKLSCDVGDDADLRIDDPVAPAGRRGCVAGVHHVGIQERDGAGARAQQPAAVLELLDAGLDEPQGVRLMRMAPVPVRQVPGAQKVDPVDRRVPPVPGDLRCHNAIPT